MQDGLISTFGLEIRCNLLPIGGSILNGHQENSVIERCRLMILRIFVGAVLGGALGFAYYKFVGCSSGACPLTSHPLISTLYGALIGALVAGSLR